MKHPGPRSFRLYRQPPPAVPGCDAGKLSEAERAEIRRQFAPTAAAIRRDQGHPAPAWGGVFLFGPWFGLLLLAPALPRWLVPWLVGGYFATLGVIAVVAVRLAVPVECPHCGNDPRRPDGDHCPECGARGLVRSWWNQAVNCPTCGRMLGEQRRSRPRNHRIRRCRCCGVLLDPEGI